MRKALIYSVVAAMLGLAIIIIPLHLAITTDAKTRYPLYPRSLGLEEQGEEADARYKKEVETSYEKVSEDLEILSISFFIAMGIYLFTRHRRPKRFYTWPPTVPY